MHLLKDKVMTKRFLAIISVLAALLFVPFHSSASPAGGHSGEEGNIDVKEIIFHHLGDGYGWEVPFSHVYRIPLPVIVRAEDGNWFCFSSSKLSEIEEFTDPVGGKTEHVAVPVVYNAERGGKTYSFVIAHVSQNANKVVEIFPLTDAEQAEAHAKAVSIKGDSDIDEGAPVLDGFVYVDGKYYREYRPFDMSVTKNVLGIFISALIVIFLVMRLVRHYNKNGLKTPRKGMGFFELCVDFIYTGTIKGVLGSKARKFAPYLLTCFFFILTMNLLGLIVIFPGGANLTGNIAVTMVLAVCTFLVTNLFATKHYWKEIFWPEVPMWLKCPLPIMPLIEVFGIFTKPAALCVRLFANMMGGHMIVITLVLLIFIFAAFGMAAAGGSIVISILFSVFMLALDVLVSFIQAYVFTLLSALFISLAQDSGHHDHKSEEEMEKATEEAYKSDDLLAAVSGVEKKN